MRTFTMAATVLGLCSLALPVGAQGTPASPEHLAAWIGCWEPIDLVRSDVLSCVTPGTAESGLRIRSVRDGSVVSTMELVVDGTPQPVEEAGCTGWQRARLSRAGVRIAIDAEVKCGDAPAERRSGAYVITASGDWMLVQGGGFSAVTTARASRWRPVSSLSRVPTDILEELGIHLVLAETARERAKASQLTASDLIELEALGVASPVIDFVVAAGYPRAFSLNPEGAFAASLSGGASEGRGALQGQPLPWNLGFGYPSLLYTDWMMQDSCSRLSWSLASLRDCSRFSRYGSGAYGGYDYFGGYWPGYSPYGTIVVVTPVPGSSGGSARSGRVVNGQGYTQSGGASSGTAHPRGASSSSAGSSSGSSTTSGSSTGSSSSGASTSSGGSSTRTAQPRKP